jgi:hypothetical protein
LDDILKAGILIFAVLIGYYVGRTSVTGWVVASPTPASNIVRTPVTDPIGHKLSIPGVDWIRNQRTLVLALQTTCHFCSESGPFYQELVRERGKFGNTRILAVLPQTVGESSAYLRTLGVAVDDVKQYTLSEIGVKGTPTLLLVDSEGVVTEAWTGRLQSLAEREVFGRLQVK